MVTFGNYSCLVLENMSSTLLQFYGGRRSTARSITITHFFIIKPTRCINFKNFILARNSTCLGVPLPIIRSLFTVHSYTQQWYTSYKFVDSYRAGQGWNCKLVHLVGFIRKKFKMHGHMNVKLLKHSSLTQYSVHTNGRVICCSTFIVTNKEHE